MLRIAAKGLKQFFPVVLIVSGQALALSVYRPLLFHNTSSRYTTEASIPTGSFSDLFPSKIR